MASLMARTALLAKSAAGAGGRMGSKNLGWYQRALAAQEQEAAAEARPPFPAAPLHGRERRRAFLDVELGGKELGRLEVELADDIVPKTVDNFLALCGGKGEGGAGYKGTAFHHVKKGFAMIAGDVEAGDGSGGHSALGTRFFDDENLAGRHSRRGVVSMASAGRDNNSSQFFITATALPQLDGRNVAFGVVVDGLDILDEIESVFTVNYKPVSDVVITDCGEV